MRPPVDPDAYRDAVKLVEDVKAGGTQALRDIGEKLGDIQSGARLIYRRAELEEALNTLADADQALLKRVAGRIEAFAEAQKASLSLMTMDIPGGQAGQRVDPVERAACYAPGGRFPLPSTVLMTAVTARVAGVSEVWVLSPKPTQVTLAAAAVAGADALLAVGGAHAIGAVTFGTDDIPACDVIVGPGNKWVTAAKQYVSGWVGIDMLAGPSELLVFADDSAAPSTVAKDLLGQAEHDDDAYPILVSTSQTLIDAVNVALEEELKTLETAPTARNALKNGFAVLVDSRQQGVEVCNQLAPEHLEIMVSNPREVADQCDHFGGIFIGEGAAEVFGDYGVGPNHVLPTGRGARFVGGLSVFNFLKVRTWLSSPSQFDSQIIEDTVRLAELEGLVAHARSAAARRS
jgi:phosphoribosyl-ATP pyrophosphohydrolase/phosphoribosyl-AMP cyclohydrolase/histidinol dehydrogenase